MMFKNPRRIASVIGLIVGLTNGLSMYLVFWLQGQTPQAVNLMLFAVGSGVVTAVIAESMIKQFMHVKLTRIYKALNNPEKYRDDMLQDAKELGRVDMEVTMWVRRAAVEMTSLRAQDTIRREFIANLSHEMKNPVFNIQGYLLTLMDGVEDAAQRERFFKKASRNVDRMIRLLRDMDVLAHLESGKLTLEQSPYGLKQQVLDAMEQMEDRLEHSGIQVHLTLPDTLDDRVMADKQRMEQVLLNLISNAIKYASENKPELHIQLIDQANRLDVVVKDNGIGIAQDDITRIFERFYRADRARVHGKQVSGTGLGLAIAKHIVEAHDQSITVAAELGHGSTFIYGVPKA